MLTDGARLGREHHGFGRLRSHKRSSLPRHKLMRRACGERFFDIRNVVYLVHRGQKQRVWILQAPRFAFLHRSNRWRTRPGRAVHGAFVFTNHPHPPGEDQLTRVDPGILIQRQLRKRPLNLFAVQHCTHLGAIVQAAARRCQPACSKKHASGRVCGLPDACRAACARKKDMI